MRNLFLIIISLFLFLFFFSSNVYAKTVFKANDVNGKVGDRVTIKVNKSDNQEFLALGIKIKYDNSKLEFDDCTINGFRKAVMKGCNENDGVIIFYAIGISRMMNDSGNIYNVYFKIKNVDDNYIPIDLKVTDYSKDLKNTLEYDTIPGKIVLKEDDNDTNTGSDSSNISVNNKSINSSNDNKTLNKIKKYDNNSNKSISDKSNSTNDDNMDKKKFSFSKDNRQIIFIIMVIILILLLFIVKKLCKVVKK